jgi:hypothetical protein
VGTRTGLDDKEKILYHTGTQNSESSVVQPTGSSYTEYALRLYGVVLNSLTTWTTSSFYPEKTLIG